MKQAVLQAGACHLDPFGQGKGALELSRGNTAMQENALCPVRVAAVILLLTTDQQLSAFDRDRQITLGEAGDSQRDTKAAWSRHFDIEWRVTVRPGAGRSFNQTFKLIKAQQQRVGRKRNACHQRALFIKRRMLRAPDAATRLLDMGQRRASARTRNKPTPFAAARMSLDCCGTGRAGTTMDSPQELSHEEVLVVKLAVLRQKHRDLDDAISALQEQGLSAQLTIQRLKKEKLRLKDQIARIEDELTPDIIA
jgi:hypothetical protein